MSVGLEAAMVHLRGHLGWGGGGMVSPLHGGTCGPDPHLLRATSAHVCVQGHLAGHKEAGFGRTRSWPCWCPQGPPCLGRHGAHVGLSLEPLPTPLPSPCLTFPALQRHQVALVIQGA